ncbi:MAG: hypothetical protein Q4F60_03040 [Candidatus Saccharibacteria bacterium]|nr:hypothetical protein [Candidatus Saccharibacteria bacterium]
MNFDEISEIPELAKKFGFTVFVVDSSLLLPEATNLKKKPIHRLLAIFPKNSTVEISENPEKGRIGVDEIMAIMETTNLRLTEDRFLVILDGKKLTPAAENALLKSLEEPREFYHYVIFTDEPYKLLPTVRSRAEIFYQRRRDYLEMAVEGSEEEKVLARRLLSESGAGLVRLVEEMTDRKKHKEPRAEVMRVMRIAIEIAEKSYYKTGKKAFLQRMEKLIRVYERVERNGHIKIQIVAGL